MKLDVTFMLTLPSGKQVRCLRREAALIRRDVDLTGNVFLKESYPGSEIYLRIAPQEVDPIDALRARHDG